MRIVSIVYFFLFALNLVNAQKKVRNILDYYESGAYHLTIKKVNDLKAKHQFKPRIQLVLADAYWQLGNKRLSTEIYEHLAVVNKIPMDYQEKYEQVMLEKSIYASLALNSIPMEDFKMPSNAVRVKGSLRQPVPLSRKQDTKLKLVSQDKVIPSIPIQPKLTKAKPVVSVIAAKELKTPIIAALESRPPLEIKRINEKRSPVKSLINTGKKKEAGKYRIRIGVKSDDEAANLIKYLSPIEVEVFEWAQRKIVVAGFYETIQTAESFIDQYLKYFYKKVVVVTKVEGRYKSVSQVL